MVPESYFTTFTNHTPSSVEHKEHDDGHNPGALGSIPWSPDPNDENPIYTIDLGVKSLISGVILKGSDAGIFFFFFDFLLNFYQKPFRSFS